MTSSEALLDGGGTFLVVLRGASGEHESPVGPICFIFMQFSAKIMSNNKVGAAPRLGNPRSATGWWWGLSRERERPYLEPKFIVFLIYIWFYFNTN